MSDITLITPPDHIYSDAYSFLLVYPSKTTKDEFNKIIHQSDVPYNVYLYEPEEPNPDWLLACANRVDCIILDIDNCKPELSNILGYLIAKPQTYWLTKGDHLYYNKLSNKQVYNLDFILTNGGNFEKELE